MNVATGLENWGFSLWLCSEVCGERHSFKTNNLDDGFSWGDIQGEHWFVQSVLSREVTMRHILPTLAYTEAATPT